MTKDNAKVKARASSSVPLPKKKVSITPKRAPHAYNRFVGEMMPVLCKIERETMPTGQRKKPCELMVDIGSLWQSRKVGNINISLNNFKLLNNIAAYSAN